MEEKQTIVLFYDYFRNVHFGKDVFLAPYFLGKQLSYNVKIVYLRCEEELPHIYKGVELVPIGNKSQWVSRIFYCFYLIFNANKIDVMMRFHLKRYTYLLVILYKLFNPKGKAYVKSDIDPMDIKSDAKPGFWMSILLKIFKKNLNVLSCETSASYDKMKMSSSPYFNFGEKLTLMPNGFDENIIKELNIHLNNFSEKENVMITIGRLGTYQKNTRMILDALEKVNMSLWKCYLIGSIEDSFLPEIEDFYRRNPDKKNNVIFTGPISDKKVLFNFYNKSKLFLLTSNFEGSPLVLPEAKRLKNYIITTKVGAAPDLLEGGKCGDIINFNDSQTLSEKIQAIIDNKTDIDVYKNYDMRPLSWEYCVISTAEALSK